MKKDMTKYYPAALIMFLNYFVHGVGCSVLGQNAIKLALATRFDLWVKNDAGETVANVAAITAISAALGLGRLIALPFAGPLSDKLGRKISTMIGGASYAIYLIGLAMAFNAGANGGYRIAYVCAIMGGIANSFLDTGIYPAVAEIIYQAPGVATMGIKFFIAISQMLMPFFLGMTVGTTASGDASYNKLFWICGLAYVALAVLIFIVPLPDTDLAAGEKKEGLLESLKKTHFSIESIAMIAIGFTCTGTFQLWLNCAQSYACDYAGFFASADARAAAAAQLTGDAASAVLAAPLSSSLQSYYSIATLVVLVGTAFLTKFIKDVRFILVYPAICVAAMVVCLIAPSPTTMILGSVCIGGFGAGGLLQIATSVCNMIFPKIKGTVTALVMIASSLCNYTLLTLASSVGKSNSANVIIMGIIVTAVGVLLGLFVNLRYAKLVEDAE